MPTTIGPLLKPFRPPADDAGGEQRPQTTRQFPQFAVEPDEAIAGRGVAGRKRFASCLTNMLSGRTALDQVFVFLTLTAFGAGGASAACRMDLA